MLPRRTRTPTLTAGVRYEGAQDVLPWLHGALLLDRRHPHVVARTVLRPAPGEVLPPRARVLRTCVVEDVRQVLAEVGRALALLEEPSSATAARGRRSRGSRR